jgi:hypothetical protein
MAPICVIIGPSEVKMYGCEESGVLVVGLIQISLLISGVQNVSSNSKSPNMLYDTVLNYQLSQEFKLLEFNY